MTRINTIDPKHLPRKALVAEYRELPRIFSMASAARDRGEQADDKRNPTEYRLGTGHVRFFYNKLSFLRRRHAELVQEMCKRGYATNMDCSSSGLELPDEWQGEWYPDIKAVCVCLERLMERKHITAFEAVHILSDKSINDIIHNIAQECIEKELIASRITLHRPMNNEPVFATRGFVKRAIRDASKYVVLVQSPRTGQHLLMVDRRKRKDAWWTSDVEDAMIYDSRGAAVDKARSLRYNNPRAVQVCRLGEYDLGTADDLDHGEHFMEWDVHKNQ